MSGQEDELREATVVVAVPHDLERRKETASASRYTPEWETRTAISRILDIVLKPVDFTQQLTETLDVVVSISWLRAEKKGAIFVANSRGEPTHTLEWGKWKTFFHLPSALLECIGQMERL